MLSRRDLVGKLAVSAAGAAVAWAAGGVRTSAASTARGAKALIGPQPAEGPVGAQLGPLPVDKPVAEVAGPVPTDAPVAVLGENLAAPSVEAAPPPWELLRPLKLGSKLAHGWRVADLSGPSEGAFVLTLQNGRGRTQRIHISRNGGRPAGLVYTKRFELVVMNGGKGDLGTDEGLAQAVAKVSHVLAANEGSWRHEPVITALLPHTERLQRFSSDSEWALR